MPGIEERLGELRGRLGALEAQVAHLVERADVPASDPHGGLKTAVTFVAAVIVPILVALLGGYFALRGAGLR